MKLFRTLIAPIVITALTVTGFSAAQAKADGDDVAKVIVGAVALAVIADALTSKDHGAVTVSSGTRSQYAGRVVEDRWHRGDRMRYALNPECLKTYRAKRGSRELYEGRCLVKTNKRIAELPKKCAVRVVVRGGKNRVAYEPRCLVRAGFWEVRQRRHDRRYDDRYYDHDRRDGRVYEDRYGHIDYGR